MSLKVYNTLEGQNTYSIILPFIETDTLFDDLATQKGVQGPTAAGTAQPGSLLAMQNLRPTYWVRTFHFNQLPQGVCLCVLESQEYQASFITCLSRLKRSGKY